MTDRIGRRFSLGHKIGGGSFGEVFLGRNVFTGEDAAIKLELLSSDASQLLYEARVYRELDGHCK